MVVRSYRCLAAVLSASLLLASCGGSTTALTTPPVHQPSGSGGSPSGFQAGATEAGSVVLPSGMATSTSSLIASDTYGTKAVASDGSFSLGTFDATDAQFVTVNSAAGTSLLAGWLSSQQPVINAQTTAEVYFYFATFAYTLPDATSRSEVLASIHALPGLSPVEQAISAALVAHPTLSPSADPTVKSSITNLIVALGGTAASAQLAARGGVGVGRPADGSRRYPFALGVAPGNTRSGITIVPESGDAFHFQNTLRRQAVAFVDEVSHKASASASPTPDQARDTNPPVAIPATNGIGSFLGTISDYLHGNYANAPVTSGEVETPNVAGAFSTEYRVAVVGPGVPDGDFASFSPVEQEEQTEEVNETIVFEAILPLFAAILVPSVKFAGLQGETANGVLKTALATLASDPHIQAAAKEGKVSEVAAIIIADIVSSPTLLEQFTEGAVELLGLASGNAVSTAAQTILKSLVLPVELVDAGIAAIDYFAIIKDETSADKGDLFTITVTDATTTLFPPASSIGPGTMQGLTAAVHPPSTETLVYQYTNTGLFGHLTDGNANHVDNFASASTAVTYTAGSTPGTDTITVTPQTVVAGLPNADLAEATATITVAPQPTPMPTGTGIVSITPSVCQQAGNQATTFNFTAHTASAPPSGESYEYGWELGIGPGVGWTLTVPPPTTQGEDPFGGYDTLGPSNTASVTTVTYDPQGEITGNGGGIGVYLYLADASGGVSLVADPNDPTGYAHAGTQIDAGAAICPSPSPSPSPSPDSGAAKHR